jgi:hypothetical protein
MNVSARRLPSGTATLFNLALVVGFSSSSSALGRHRPGKINGLLAGVLGAGGVKRARWLPASTSHVLSPPKWIKWGRSNNMAHNYHNPPPELQCGQRGT